VTETTKAPSLRRRWALLAAIAFTVLAADQVTKFLAVKHLTRTFEVARAETLSEQVSAFVKEKHLRERGLSLGPRPVVPVFWSHIYAENPGAAWSMFASWPDHVRIPFFHVISVLAIGLIGFYFHKLKSDQRLLQVALALVMGGALGNLLDRFLRGYVIDFIDWHLNDPLWVTARWHWPTFNIADAGISLGVGLIALDTLLVWLEQRRAARRPAAAGA
jgi:signal peptidase II